MFSIVIFVRESPRVAETQGERRRLPFIKPGGRWCYDMGASLYTFKVNLIIYSLNKYTTQWPSLNGRWPIWLRKVIAKLGVYFFLNFVIFWAEYEGNNILGKCPNISLYWSKYQSISWISKRGVFVNSAHFVFTQFYIIIHYTLIIIRVHIHHAEKKSL